MERCISVYGTNLSKETKESKIYFYLWENKIYSIKVQR